MLRLLLLRHAEAAPAGGVSDIDRRLTPGGKAGAARLGAYITQAALRPDLTIVSPAKRTLETLCEIERQLAEPPARVITPALYNGSMTTIKALLAETPSDIGALLVIAHNPGLAETAVHLSRRGDRADLARMRAQFPAPCLAVIDFDAADWRRATHGGGRLVRFITLATLQKSRGGA